MLRTLSALALLGLAAWLHPVFVYAIGMLRGRRMDDLVSTGVGLAVVLAHHHREVAVGVAARAHRLHALHAEHHALVHRTGARLLGMGRAEGGQGLCFVLTLAERAISIQRFAAGANRLVETIHDRALRGMGVQELRPLDARRPQKPDASRLDEAPLGGLEAAAQLGRGDFKNLMAFTSLSKRSNVPGLRIDSLTVDEGEMRALKNFDAGIAHNPRRFDNYAPNVQNYVVFDDKLVDIIKKY